MLFFCGIWVLWNEASWRKMQGGISKSPEGSYVANVSTIYKGGGLLFEGASVGTKVHVWPKWVPVPSLMAREVLAAPCKATVYWKSDRELHITCPNPEGLAKLQIHPWSLNIILKDN